MTSVADSIEIRSHGIAGATLATVIAPVRGSSPRCVSGFPRWSPKAEKFAFGGGASVVTVRVASVSFRDPNGVRWELCVVLFSSMLASLPADDPGKTH